MDDLDILDDEGIPIGEGIIELAATITYSGYVFTHAQMDLKHINFGTHPDGSYKVEVRSSYTKEEVIEFLHFLDGISKDEADGQYNDENGTFYRYKEKISSPIQRTLDVEHLLVFDVYENFDDVLISITLFEES